jgi:2-hydroxychromene-2-carboxylate isomerase
MTFCEQWPPRGAEGSARELHPTPGSKGELLRSFALAAMRLAFLEGADLGELDAVLEAGRRTGIEQDELRGALSEQRLKDALRARTDEALTLGIFGVPTVLLGKQLFWGDDRLEESAAAFGSGRDE